MAGMWKLRWGGRGSLIFFVLLALAGGVVAIIWLGLAHLDRESPWVNLQPQGEVVGAKTAFTLEAGDPDSGLKEARVTITQGPLEKVVLIRRFPPGGDPGVKVELPFTLEPQALGLKEGKARMSASVRDRSWRSWFQGRTATLSREVTIDLVPLNLAFLSVNHLRSGGSGLIRYRLSKPAKESGVTIGGRFFAGFAEPGGPQGEYVALFAVPRETPGAVTAELTAKPDAGAPVQQRVSLKVKPRRWRQDRLKLSEEFTRRVAASFQVANPGDPLAAFLEVNREMRRANHERLRQVCSQSRAQPLWIGGFQRFQGKPMARYGDRRSYLYQGRQVDQQVHLGEDLASLVHSPVPAANNGLVALAEPLGIYGETVVLDHGLGVFSMYSHLSQINVKPGEEVKKGAAVGKTGMTGLAGGDHLHFSMLLQGEFVDPMEWWDPRWLKGQLEGQWKQAGAPSPPAKAAAAPAKGGKGKAKPKGKARPDKSRRPS